MKSNNELFWKKKSFSEMTPEEWESLCDGCGICCLEKLEDEETGKIYYTYVACQNLGITDCRCKIYECRLKIVPSCIMITPDNVGEITWLPETCAYRLLSEGKELEWWHPLVSKDPESVHQANISVRDKVISGQYVHPDDIEGYVM